MQCHINLHKPRCKGCRLPIADGDIISALRGKWHPHCFVCEACRRPFESPNFFIRGNKAYDEDCCECLRGDGLLLGCVLLAADIVAVADKVLLRSEL